MKLIAALLLVPALALAQPNSAGQLATDRVAAAKKVLDGLSGTTSNATSEDMYRWSVRLLDAQLDDPAHAVAAEGKRSQTISRG